MLGVGVLLFEEVNVLCEKELESSGCDGLGGNDWEGLEGNDCGEGPGRDGW